MAAHGVEASLIVFAVSLLVGGFGISLGAKLAFKSKDYSHAVVTALLGAVAWALVTLSLLALLGVGGLDALGIPGI